MPESYSSWQQDAKLSTAQRNKLKTSTFCGPGRSFPVPDCAHVTAARRLLGRAKASSSTKAKILSCVNRKAKSLGCDSSKDSDTSPEIETLIASETFDDTRELIAFLEHSAADADEIEKSFETAKEKAASILETLRSSKQNRAFSTEKATDYVNRSLVSLLDSIEDTLSEMNKK